MDALARGIRYALRQLGRNPGFAIVAVTTIGLGIAATTAAYGTITVALARPIPVRETVIALFLGIIGLYGVTAYAASQRTREIGVRIALGATNFHIHRTVARTAITQLAMGLVLGAAGGTAVSRILPSQLAGASANAPTTVALVALMLVVAGLTACWIPAQRALKIDPAVALRDG